MSFLSGCAFISYGNKLGGLSEGGGGVEGFKRCALDLPAANGPCLIGRVGALRHARAVMNPLVTSLTHSIIVCVSVLA